MAEPEGRSDTKVDDREPADMTSTVDDERSSPDETMVDARDPAADDDPGADRDPAADDDPASDGDHAVDGETGPATADAATSSSTQDATQPRTDDAMPADRAEDGTAAEPADGISTTEPPDSTTDQTGSAMGGSAGTAEHLAAPGAEVPPETDDVEASAHETQGLNGTRDITGSADAGASVPGMRAAAPGEIAQPAVDLWPNEKITALRERWQEVQLHFVDDPTAAAVEADALVSEAVQTLTDSLVHQRQDLGGWQGDAAGDTERLRVAVQRYRSFLDRLFSL